MGPVPEAGSGPFGPLTPNSISWLPRVGIQGRNAAERETLRKKSTHTSGWLLVLRLA